MGRPSDERRAYLRSADQDVSSFPVSNFCPIQRYYGAADRALEAFEDSFSCLNLDKAYSLGRRFAMFSTEALPKHDYYKSPKAELVKLRLKNQKDIKHVLDLMEQVVALMDKEEIQRQKQREEEARKEKERQEELLRLQESQRQCELSEKLKNLDFMFPKVPTGVGPTHQIPDEPPPPPYQPSYSKQHDIPPDDHHTQTVLQHDLGPLPTPLPILPSAPSIANEPAPPPSYADLIKLNHSAAPNTAFWDVANDISHQAPIISPEETIPTLQLKQSIPVRTRLANARHDHDKLTSQNQIEKFYLSTYQGRITSIPNKDSTNGCAVISPLVAALHLQSDEKGVTNAHIAKVIDELAPPILLRVRKKLGLGKNAFIIPSDVHDFLVDEQILLQEQFVGAVGGNILDDDHVSELLKLLETASDQIMNGESSNTNGYTKPFKHKKVAGALFFHEHVVSIVKTVLPGGTKCYYDLVDSMPDLNTNSATRTRCKSIDAFKVEISYYALRRFSPNQLDYIDKNDWNADMVDFDPRVYQAFVWKE